MKIGIMTFWWSQDNYGQLLQCYALQKYLRDLGHDAFLIRYRQLPRKHGLIEKLWKYGCHPWRIMEGFSRVAKRRQTRQYESQHGRHFDEFRSRYIKQSECEYTTIAELRQNPPKADMYIVGSDQVWNVTFDYRPDDVQAYLLQFGDANAIRCSYAASFGIKRLPAKIKAQVKNALSGFKAISCREKSGVDICSGLDITARVVCDPTLLLEKEKWDGLREETDLPPQDTYILAYMINNYCTFSYQKLANWAAQQGLSIIYVKGNAIVESKYDDEDATQFPLSIGQWIAAVSGAKYIVTNSFHCSVFSSIYGKKCGVVPMEGISKDTNDRFTSLYERIGAVGTFIRANDFNVLLDSKPAFWTRHPEVIGKDFLRNITHGC